MLFILLKMLYTSRYNEVSIAPPLSSVTCYGMVFFTHMITLTRWCCVFYRGFGSQSKNMNADYGGQCHHKAPRANSFFVNISSPVLLLLCVQCAVPGRGRQYAGFHSEVSIINDFKRGTTVWLVSCQNNTFVTEFVFSISIQIVHNLYLFIFWLTF